MNISAIVLELDGTAARLQISHKRTRTSLSGHFLESGIESDFNPPHKSINGIYKKIEKAHPGEDAKRAYAAALKIIGDFEIEGAEKSILIEKSDELYTDMIVSINDAKNMKPASGGLERIPKKFSTAPEKMILAGDSAKGAAAVQFDLHAFGMLSGIGDESKLKDAERKNMQNLYDCIRMVE